jgi:hypothetical protein
MFKALDGDSVIRGREIRVGDSSDGSAEAPRFSGFRPNWRMLLAGKKKRAVALSGTLAVLSVFCWSCSDQNPNLASGKIVYRFLANAQSAQIASYNRERVNFAAEFTINKEKRPILWEHPTAEVQFDDVAIPQNAVLQFGIGISPEAWDKKGDGVTFEITVLDQKSAKIQIFSSYIDPKNNSGDRKWFDTDVDLKDFAGQKMSFIFGTTFGPRGNGDFDWAGWSDPRIRLKTGG